MSKIHSKCKVLQCKERHSVHYCKNCDNTNSNHFSSQCAFITKNVISSNNSNNIKKQSCFSFFNFSGNKKKECMAKKIYLLLPYLELGKWKLISEILTIFINKEIDDIEDLEYFMKQLYSIGADNFNFYQFQRCKNLRNLFNYDQKAFSFFINTLLPFLASLAMELPNLLKQNDLNFLVQKTNSSVALNKLQVACLLSHMFFGTISNVNGISPNLSESINFSTLLFQENTTNIEKIKCLINYFSQIRERQFKNSNDLLSQTIIFTRICDKSKRLLNFWLNSDKPLQKFIIHKSGGIEENDQGNSIQVDFANKFVGGGTLRNGSVQEEIKFITCPECIASMLFFEFFEDNEVGIISGAEEFSKYKGYSQNFEYDGPSKKPLKLNAKGNLDETVLCLDALSFNNPSDQFRKENILRELNKAYIGFQSSHKNLKIITGKWGCGVFRGYPQLKFLIQWLACSQCEKEMEFCSYGDRSLEKVENLFEKFKDKRVMTVVKGILDFEKKRFNGSKVELFDFLLDDNGNELEESLSDAPNESPIFPINARGKIFAAEEFSPPKILEVSSIKSETGFFLEIFDAITSVPLEKIQIILKDKYNNHKEEILSQTDNQGRCQINFGDAFSREILIKDLKDKYFEFSCEIVPKDLNLSYQKCFKIGLVSRAARIENEIQIIIVKLINNQLDLKIICPDNNKISHSAGDIKINNCGYDGFGSVEIKNLKEKSGVYRIYAELAGNQNGKMILKNISLFIVDEKGVTKKNLEEIIVQEKIHWDIGLVVAPFKKFISINQQSLYELRKEIYLNDYDILCNLINDFGKMPVKEILEFKNKREKKYREAPALILFNQLMDIARIFGFKNEAEEALFFKSIEDKIILLEIINY